MRKSSTNDENLQSYIKIEFGNERKLQLDCCTRWYFLETMLSGFLNSLVLIKKSLIYLGKNFNLLHYEIQNAKDVRTLLIPLKEAVLALSTRENDIMMADNIMELLFEELSTRGTFFLPID